MADKDLSFSEVRDKEHAPFNVASHHHIHLDIASDVATGISGSIGIVCRNQFAKRSGINSLGSCEAFVDARAGASGVE